MLKEKVIAFVVVDAIEVGDEVTFGDDEIHKTRPGEEVHFINYLHLDIGDHYTIRLIPVPDF